jgi:hypothetical protein
MGAKPAGGGGGYPCAGLNMGTPPGGCTGGTPPGIPILMGGIGTPTGTDPGGCIGACMAMGVNPAGGGGAAANAPANWPWYGPVKPGMGCAAPYAAAAGRGASGSALFFLACAAKSRSAAVP